MGLVVSAATSCGDLLGRRSSTPPPPPIPSATDTTPPPNDTTPEPEPEPESKTTETERKLINVFRRFDADGDGRISAAEMREYCGCTSEEAEEMVAAADRDGDGFISLEELGALFEDGDRTDELRAAFAQYDEDGDGVITAEELLRALRRLGFAGEEMTAERCMEIVAAVDRNGDGVVSFDEFKAMMTAEPAA